MVLNSSSLSLFPLHILVVDDEVNIRRTLTLCLELVGHKVIAVGNGGDALKQAAQHKFDLIFLDMRLGTERGLDYIPKLLMQLPEAHIIIITAYATVDTAVAAMKSGAVDYLPKPFTPEQVQNIAANIATKRQQIQEKVNTQEIDLQTQSPAMEKVLRLAKQVAPTETGVLLRGESGTGKGVLARAIHDWSKRKAKPFGVISCPSLSIELLESELFGHVKGAFTGAVRDNLGRISAHDGGTLFLDEIGDLALITQPKLLRFLQDQEYERVGENITRRANIRIIAATNIDLEQAVREGKFREDLLFRLNVFQIELPPLRTRIEDIPALVERFAIFFAKKNQRSCPIFSPTAMDALIHYSWPGNIRELRNSIERACIVCNDAQINLDDLPSQLQLTSAASPEVGHKVSLEQLEEIHIRKILASTPSLEEAARILDIDGATLWRRRKKYGL